MPTVAAAIAAQVRAGTGVRNTMRASSAVSSGPTAITSNVFAVVVNDSASMKAENITPHIAPEIRPGRPAATTGRNPSRRTSNNQPAMNTAANSARQKVISKRPSDCSSGDSQRVTTPAVDHSSVTSTISAMARRCCRDMMDDE